VQGGEHQINNHDDGFIIRDAKRRIAAAIGIDENISNNALRILFGPYDKFFNVYSKEEVEFEAKYKLINEMNLREFNAFLINNKEKLIELFSEISAREIADIEQTEILKLKWDAPKEQYYKMHKRLAGRKVMNNNIFKDYRDNILIDPNRSYSERMFEDYCEKSNNTIEWVYKNGDKGMQFFSLVYHMAFKRANFYPDYIVKTKTGEIWIIEAKGGMSADGESRNIDKYAKNKFEATKEYASRCPNIKWGFVRAVGNNLYLSNTEWTEDMFNQNIWKPIEDYL
jgi:type III restriction enzyme